MIRFRKHHFLCTLGFQGKGYSPEFVEGFQKIFDLLGKEEDTPIAIVKDTDSICTPCPNRRGEKCTDQTRIETLDEAHGKILEIKEGQTLTWKEAREKIKEKFTLEKFHKACVPCGWKELGVCEVALKNLRGEK